MSFFNSVLRGLLDLLLMPFLGLPPWVSLLLISLLTAIMVLLVYGRVSNQIAITEVKRSMAASFFEIRLFNDDLRAILRAQLDLLRNNARYLFLNLKPLAWMIVPFTILMVHLHFHYGYEGLRVGDSTVVTLDLAGQPEGSRPEIELRCPTGLQIESAGVWIPVLNQMAWRVRALESGRYELELERTGERNGAETWTKTLVVSDTIARRSPQRLAGGLLNQLFYPAEDPLPSGSSARAIQVDYPERSVRILGVGLHWMYVWLGLSLVIAFLLRKPFGVTF